MRSHSIPRTAKRREGEGRRERCLTVDLTYKSVVTELVTSSGHGLVLPHLLCWIISCGMWHGMSRASFSCLFCDLGQFLKNLSELQFHPKLGLKSELILQGGCKGTQGAHFWLHCLLSCQQLLWWLCCGWAWTSGPSALLGAAGGIWWRVLIVP